MITGSCARHQNTLRKKHLQPQQIRTPLSPEKTNKKRKHPKVQFNSSVINAEKMCFRLRGRRTYGTPFLGGVSLSSMCTSDCKLCRWLHIILNHVMGIKSGVCFVVFVSEGNETKGTGEGPLSGLRGSRLSPPLHRFAYSNESFVTGRVQVTLGQLSATKIKYWRQSSVSRLAGKQHQIK